MSLNREEVQHIATLCRIGMTEEDLETMGEELSHILEQFEVLQQVDTDDLLPTAHSVALENVLRADEIQSSLDRDYVLSNAPNRQDELFRVMTVLEE